MFQQRTRQPPLGQFGEDPAGLLDRRGQGDFPGTRPAEGQPRDDRCDGSAPAEFAQEHHPSRGYLVQQGASGQVDQDAGGNGGKTGPAGVHRRVRNGQDEQRVGNRRYPTAQRGEGESA
jgi:hypothetical protein